MDKVDSKEFEKMINKNPSWCLNLATPLEVIGFVNLSNTDITTLSPLLHFTYGGDSNNKENNWGAKFESCKNLKVAEGNFASSVSFWGSGIEKIGSLCIKKADHLGWAVHFGSCKNLKIATGEYPGFIDFRLSGVKKIINLIIHKGTQNYTEFEEGTKACFKSCKLKNLENLEYLLNGKWVIDKEIEKELQKVKLRKTLSRLQQTF